MRVTFGFLLLVIFLTACSANEHTSNEVSEKAKQDVEEVDVIDNLDEKEVQEILKTNLDSIFNTFTELGEENGWGNANPADFNIIKPEILSYVTDEFADSTIKDLSAEFYCECDHPFKPAFNDDVQFMFEQNKDKLIITALDPATEMNNMGMTWEFELIKEDNAWKMNRWNNETLDSTDLQLSKEEAEKILTRNGETPTFIKEYESNEASGKAYLFSMKSANGERLVAISSKDTSLVTDYELEKGTEEKVKNQNETLEEMSLYDEFYEKLHFGLTREELISKFGNPIVEKELSSEITLTYVDAVYTISNISNQIYKVDIIGDKASTYYSDFDEVIKAYYPDPVYAEYYDEKTNDENGYHLTLDDGYSKSHIFTSENENGNPIKSISIQILEFK